MTAARIAPLEAPFDPPVDAVLEKMGPRIALFRTFAHNIEMADAMNSWGSYELSKRLSVSLRIREIVIDRVCALCRCEYEWGVHVAFFAAKAGFDDAQVRSLTHGSPSDACWTSPAERAVLSMVDALHADADVDDELWATLRSHFSEAQVLDLLLLAGWYHAISYAANAARVPLEDGAPRFVDY
ncbi:MAG TPA: hypothetical protein VEA78_03930 [Acidimicrobiales bacterium]|nr:hypothetical protein [Acidimicrobiales bacterium]